MQFHPSDIRPAVPPLRRTCWKRHWPCVWKKGPHELAAGLPFLSLTRVYKVYTYIHTYKDTYIHRVCISIDGVTYQSSPYNPHLSLASKPLQASRHLEWWDWSQWHQWYSAGGCEINGKVCRWEVQWCSMMLTNKNENSTIKNMRLKSTYTIW